ncbi:glycoside hydrolase family 13 protein [Sistotremastrum suecicum HHB10207 ss-3]|uniref:alpha-amylase n=1 Tax=Sistotremastrum suecicum HHB10207 ss-3 TaxID=1314776 RepID=A0A166IXJ1_9AGAM|nr:glycoside hydrolase family 13 protein [Sistotremastrum suecicum HHB10207 ss-3]
MLNLQLFLFILSHLSYCALAATADQWRGRSIYQVVTDRYALPPNAPNSTCDPGQQTWCGGTWNSITANLDYIQNAGFTAVWISPVSQNWEGPRTPYGDAYTGYWVQDISQLNEHFGTSDDLKALSSALHSRGMYLMVDVVINNVMALSTKPDYSNYFLKDASQYHPYCPVDWGNRTSEMNCWLGDTKVTLPDVNTTNPTVVSAYQQWIQQFVQEYSVDGLRIDAAKHVNADFWPGFCQAAGIFCMGEVFGNDIGECAEYQGVMDSVLNYPIYDALVQAFQIPGPGNMTGLVEVMKQSQQSYRDVTVLGNFLENQDNPRWTNISVDPQSMYNAITYNFMSDGIPIVYYGQEQRLNGNNDPWNRGPLWPTGYVNSSTYQLITTLNTFRNFLVNTTDWATSNTSVLTIGPNELAIMKGSVISVLTNVGSPPQNSSIAVYTPYPQSAALLDIFTCVQYAVGSNGAVEVSYASGGQAVVLIPSVYLAGSGLCGYTKNANIKVNNKGSKGSLESSAPATAGIPSLIAMALVSLVFATSSILVS